MNTLYSFRRRLIFSLLKLSDIFIIIFSLMITVWFVMYQNNQLTFTELLSLRIKLVHIFIVLGMIFSWYFLFNSFNLYRSRRLDSGQGEWKDIVKATTVGTAVYTFTGKIFDVHSFTPLFISVFWIISTTLTISFRILLRYSLEKLRTHGKNLRFVLIAGTNSKSYEFARKLEEKKELGYRVLGFIDKKIYQASKNFKFLGNIEDLPALMKEHVIDELIITLPIKSCYEEIQNIVQKAEEQGIIVRQFSQIFETRITKSREETFEDFNLLTFNPIPHRNSQYLMKRSIDIMLSSLFIIISLPIMVFVYIAIKLSSPGPVIYIQDRIGYNKRVFRLYKFRTMILDAEEMQKELEGFNNMDGPVFKIKNDPRVTKIGRLLRKTSIDELPQLFNVLKGEMSLVGPRPLPIRDYSGFNHDWQRRRFSVLPGITCIWQINGRNNVSFEDWMKMDMEYIDNWNLSHDLEILVKTIPAVIRGRGAA